MLVLCFSFISALLIGNSLPYLYSQKEIRLLCHQEDGSSFLCSQEEACESGSFSYTHSRSESLQNWVVDYELACSAEASLSLLGTAFFGGYLVGALLFLPLADRVGRKPIVLSGLGLLLLSMLLLVFIK